MKISNTKIGPSTAQVDGAKASKTARSEGTPRANSAEIKQSTQVSVSPRAQSMQRAKEIAGADTVDEAKVARLQKMIDEGSYKVDAESIADRLVDEHMLIPD